MSVDDLERAPELGYASFGQIIEATQSIAPEVDEQIHDTFARDAIGFVVATAIVYKDQFNDPHTDQTDGIELAKKDDEHPLSMLLNLDTIAADLEGPGFLERNGEFAQKTVAVLRKLVSDRRERIARIDAAVALHSDEIFLAPPSESAEGNYIALEGAPTFGYVSRRQLKAFLSRRLNNAPGSQFLSEPHKDKRVEKVTTQVFNFMLGLVGAANLQENKSKYIYNHDIIGPYATEVVRATTDPELGPLINLDALGVICFGTYDHGATDLPRIKLAKKRIKEDLVRGFMKARTEAVAQEDKRFVKTI